MGPHELIEWILYGVFGLIVLPIVVFGFVKTGKKRMLALMTAGVLCLMFGSFLMSQPDDEDIKAEIQENVAAVKPYLAKEFPGEKWTISTVPFQKEGYQHVNPYFITVVFQNEPDAAYEYNVNRNGRVELVGFSSKSDYHEFNHLEK
ncbi:hypothetical protein [Exiguobacterium sp. s138]|uniref:hypothetical protein n=1 Tax=Exiguobacterium sp. s138 TaxID=2751202 RepID=UPI001BEBD5E7|nr:hypothetical protein [Exiguobacterium sp. s138]